MGRRRRGGRLDDFVEVWWCVGSIAACLRRCGFLWRLRISLLLLGGGVVCELGRLHSLSLALISARVLAMALTAIRRVFLVGR